MCMRVGYQISVHPGYDTGLTVSQGTEEVKLRMAQLWFQQQT